MKTSQLKSFIKESLRIILEECRILQEQINSGYRFVYYGDNTGNVYGVSSASSIENAWDEFKKITVRTGEDASDAEYDRAKIIEKQDGYWGIDHPQSNEGTFVVIDMLSNNPILVDYIKEYNIKKYADEYVSEKNEWEKMRNRADEAGALSEIDKNSDVNEVSMTGGAGGEAYTIPAAFSRRGGSFRGVNKSAGYKLTPIGKKEMNRKADTI
jgi:hypothetical protein